MTTDATTRHVEAVTRQLPSNQYRFTFNGMGQIYSVRAPSLEIAYHAAISQLQASTTRGSYVSAIYSVDVNVTEWTEL